MHRRERVFLYVIAFSSGLVSLAVELAASSLLQAHFGTASPVWATIIGLILLYLTIGYFLGGRWADRSPQPVVLFQVVAWAAFLIGLIPFAAGPVLTLASSGFVSFDVAMVAGSFLAVLMLFSAPMILLGCVSPFVIRLAVEDVDHSGRVAGRVYAISTAGSFLGSFLPSLLLIPLLGTRNTFLLLSFFLLAVALLGLFRTRPRRAWLYLAMPLLVMLLAFLLRGQPIKSAAGMIYETESSYNYIQVIERGGCRYLLLNEGQGIHSVYCEDQVGTSGPWDYFLIAPYFNPPPHTPDDIERIALVGLAAGTITRQFDAVYGPIPMLGIEIDSKIVDVGRRYFAMDEPSLDVVVADGRYALKRSDQRFDLVGVDAYRLPYIPPHLTTVEFFQEVRDRLTADGVLVINVGHTLDDYRLVEAMKATLLRVFPSVYVINVPDSYNAIVVATVAPSRAGNLEENLQYVAQNEFLYRTSLSALDNLRPTEVSPVVFTDDRAPIELMTNALLVDFFFARAVD